MSKNRDDKNYRSSERDYHRSHRRDSYFDNKNDRYSDSRYGNYSYRSSRYDNKYGRNKSPFRQERNHRLEEQYSQASSSTYNNTHEKELFSNKDNYQYKQSIDHEKNKKELPQSSPNEFPTSTDLIKGSEFEKNKEIPASLNWDLITSENFDPVSLLKVKPIPTNSNKNFRNKIDDSQPSMSSPKTARVLTKNKDLKLDKEYVEHKGTTNLTEDALFDEIFNVKVNETNLENIEKKDKTEIIEKKDLDKSNNSSSDESNDSHDKDVPQIKPSLIKKELRKNLQNIKVDEFLKKDVGAILAKQKKQVPNEIFERKFLPHQMPIEKKVKEKNLFIYLSEINGPEKLLQKFLENGDRVLVTTRKQTGVYSNITGQLMLFDKHHNLFLKNVRVIWKPSKKKKVTWINHKVEPGSKYFLDNIIIKSSVLKRPSKNQIILEKHFPQMFVRGSNIINIQLEPADQLENFLKKLKIS